MAQQTYNPTDVLRLEVAQEPDGPVNLVRNPSGELGGWGYITPVAGTTVNKYPTVPTYLQLKGAATPVLFHVLTESVPVTVGHTIAGRLEGGGGAGLTHARLRFVFLDAAGAQVALGAQTGYLPLATVMQAPGVVVPAGAVSAQLRVDLYASNTGAAPTAPGAYALVREVTVITSPDGSGLGSIRVNLFPSPSFELTTLPAGLEAGSNAVAATSTEWAEVGTRSLKVWRDDPEGFGSAQVTFDHIACTPGKHYQVQLRVRLNAGAGSSGSIRAGFNHYDAGGTFIGPQVTGDTETKTAVQAAGGEATLSFDHIPLTGSATFRLFVRCDQLPGDTTGAAYVDAVMIEQADEAGAYFDGATTDAGGVDYAWAGTAHASQSTATVAGELPYIEPTQWLDVLGPTHSIEVNREALQVGTLQAVIRDVSLAPYQADGIRPGRECRLLVLAADNGWTPLFVGELDAARVEFDAPRMLPGSTDPKRAIITLVAVDAAATLANTSRLESVATIVELPYVLEGAGVPWNVNGSSGQVGAATVTATNDNASALDQVAITRDTALGFAWVDRFGVLQAHDADVMPGADTEAIGEDRYSSVGLGYDSDACVNTVTVAVLTLDPVTGTTEAVTFGPYVDADSVAAFGVHAATFTVAIPAADESTVAAYADAILTANAVPLLRAEEVTMPVTTVAGHLSTADGERVALLDLYENVLVTNTAEGFSERQRITRIRHLFRAREAYTGPAWTMALGFTADGTVAQPGAVPLPSPGGGGKTIGQLLRPVGEVTMWYGAKADCPAGWLVLDGASFSGTDYPELATLLGATLLPNMTDVFPIGAGTKALGSAGGSPTYSLPSHQHNAGTLGTAQTGDIVTRQGGTNTNVPGPNHTHNVTGSTANAGADTISTMPPWRALWFIIRAK